MVHWWVLVHCGPPSDIMVTMCSSWSLRIFSYLQSWVSRRIKEFFLQLEHSLPFEINWRWLPSSIQPLNHSKSLWRLPRPIYFFTRVSIMAVPLAQTFTTSVHSANCISYMNLSCKALELRSSSSQASRLRTCTSRFRQMKAYGSSSPSSATTTVHAHVQQVHGINNSKTISPNNQ